MPWRMPNWKMRANADDDGMPTTSDLQNADARVRLHHAHQPHDRRRPT